MAPVELFRKIAARPFVPFRIVLSDRTGHDVTHPELIAVGTRTTILATIGEQDLRLDNLHITQLQPLASHAGHANGSEAE
jgi:hypothetical protein